MENSNWPSNRQHSPNMSVHSWYSSVRVTKKDRIQALSLCEPSLTQRRGRMKSGSILNTGFQGLMGLSQQPPERWSVLIVLLPQRGQFPPHRSRYNSVLGQYYVILMLKQNKGVHIKPGTGKGIASQSGKPSAGCKGSSSPCEEVFQVQGSHLVGVEGQQISFDQLTQHQSSTPNLIISNNLKNEEKNIS